MGKHKKNKGLDQTEKSDDRNILQRIKEKSEDDFEKNITYISAGALAISLTFLEKIVPIKESTQIYLVIASWSFLALTLLSNLFSHQYSSYIIDKTIDDVDFHSDRTNENWERRTKKIRMWNVINVIGLILGIGLFIIFVSINVTDMAKAKTSVNVNSNSSKGQAGRTPAKPSPTKTSPTDSTKTNK